MSRINAQIHDIGQGSDKLYKKKLSTIEKFYRESCLGLDEEKSGELDAIARTCEAQVHNLESIFAEDKELYKEILIKVRALRWVLSATVVILLCMQNRTIHRCEGTQLFASLCG